MNDVIRMTIVLSLICVTAALALSQVYRVTKEPIAAALEAEAKEAAATVLGPVMVEGATIEKRAGGPDGGDLFVATANGAAVGVAFPVVSPKGYSGAIKGMLGLDKDGNVLGYKVVQHAETPGLGSHIATNVKWLKQLAFKGEARRNLENTDWRVKKDGGEIDALTGATISPRAVTGSIKAGLEWYRDNRATLALIPDAAPPEPDADPTPDPKLEEGGVTATHLPAAVALPQIDPTPETITGKTLTE